MRKDAEGDFKVTFVSEKGFHHGWKTDLKELEGPQLLAIYEAGKDFLNMDPNRRFLDYNPPAGYDPLALEREIKKSLDVVSDLLNEKWRKEQPSISQKEHSEETATESIGPNPRIRIPAGMNGKKRRRNAKRKGLKP